MFFRPIKRSVNNAETDTSDRLEEVLCTLNTVDLKQLHLSNEEIKINQLNDPDLQEVIEYCKINNDGLSNGRFKEINGLLCKHTRSGNPLLVVPFQYHDKVLYLQFL